MYFSLKNSCLFFNTAKRIILVMIFLVPGHFVKAQDEKIDPERPDVSESADLVAAHTFQAEFGFNKDNNFGKDYDLLYPTTLFKYGLNKIELRLEAEMRSSYIHLVPNPQWQSGLDPVVLGFKINLAKEKKFFPKTSLITSFGIPFLASKVFRANQIAPSFKLVMINSFGDNASLSYNLGAEWDGYNSLPQWLYSISQDFELGRKWNIYAEIYGFFQKNELPQHSVDTGIGYCFSNNTKIDLSGGFRITNSAPKSFVAAGYSFRVNTRKKK